MRSSLLVRIAAIALGVMALTLLVAAVLTQQLIRVEYRQDLDRLLKQELAEVRLGLPAQIEAATRAPTMWHDDGGDPTCGTALPGDQSGQRPPPDSGPGDRRARVQHPRRPSRGAG